MLPQREAAKGWHGSVQSEATASLHLLTLNLCGVNPRLTLLFPLNCSHLKKLQAGHTQIIDFCRYGQPHLPVPVHDGTTGPLALMS